MFIDFFATALQSQAMYFGTPWRQVARKLTPHTINSTVQKNDQGSFHETRKECMSTRGEKLN